MVLIGSDVHSGNSVLNAGAQQFIGRSWLTPESITCATENAIERFKLIAEQSSAERKLREGGVRDFALPDVLYLIVDQQHRWNSVLLPDPSPRILDPLLIGELQQDCVRKYYLIDQFNLTEAEQYLTDEFAIRSDGYFAGD